MVQIGFLEEAEQTFLHLLEKYPNNEELYLGLAEVAIENDNSDQALNFIEKVPKDSDYYVQALLLSADLYQMIGIPEVSEAKLTEAAKILPDESLIQFALAELFFNTERFGEAATIYQILLNSGITEMADILLEERLGTALSMEGQFEEAIIHLRLALET